MNETPFRSGKSFRFSYSPCKIPQKEGFIAGAARGDTLDLSWTILKAVCLSGLSPGSAGRNVLSPRDLTPNSSNREFHNILGYIEGSGGPFDVVY